MIWARKKRCHWDIYIYIAYTLNSVIMRTSLYLHWKVKKIVLFYIAFVLLIKAAYSHLISRWYYWNCLGITKFGHDWNCKTIDCLHDWVWSLIDKRNSFRDIHCMWRAFNIFWICQQTRTFILKQTELLFRLGHLFHISSFSPAWKRQLIEYSSRKATVSEIGNSTFIFMYMY